MPRLASHLFHAVLPAGPSPRPSPRFAGRGRRSPRPAPRCDGEEVPDLVPARAARETRDDAGARSARGVRPPARASRGRRRSRSGRSAGPGGRRSRPGRRCRRPRRGECCGRSRTACAGSGPRRPRLSSGSKGSLTPSARAVGGISCIGPIAPADEIRCGCPPDSTCTMAPSSPQGRWCALLGAREQRRRSAARRRRTRSADGATRRRPAPGSCIRGGTATAERPRTAPPTRRRG